MFSSFRNRFGIPGVISVIALVFAMLGGAYAASNDSGSGKATASAKAKKGPRGPKGKTGPAGPAGPQGPAGANGKDGANGSNGLDGENGTNGTNGTNGKNAEAISFTGTKGPIGGVTCTKGGLEVKSASPTTLVCNGADGAPGAQGPQGPQGTFSTEPLPAGESLTGAWGFGSVPKVTVTECESPGAECKAEVKPDGLFDALIAPISFPIPLASELDETNVHFLIVSDSATTECPGSAADPKAIAGHLCVYANKESGPGTFNSISIEKAGSVSSGASKSGAMVRALFWKEGAFASGTWAVTAPPPAP